MQIQVVNRGIDVSEALRERIEERVADAISKYIHRPGEAFVVIERDGPGFRVDCSVHLPSGAMLQTRATGGDAYGVAEISLDRLEKRLRRYKRRMVNRRGARNANNDVAAEPAAAAHVVLQRLDLPEDDLEDDLGDDGEERGFNGAGGDEPVVVAEATAELPTLTVGMAVFELELTDAPVLVFLNAAHGALNVVFRRPDGHIGWIDPVRGAGVATSS
jgi:ribosomal subunit interface protein